MHVTAGKKNKLSPYFFMWFEKKKQITLRQYF